MDGYEDQNYWKSIISCYTPFWQQFVLGAIVHSLWSLLLLHFAHVLARTLLNQRPFIASEDHNVHLCYPTFMNLSSQQVHAQACLHTYMFSNIETYTHMYKRM